MTEISDLVDIGIGPDGDFLAGAGGDFALVIGIDSLAQEISNELGSTHGTAPWDDEGTFGLDLIYWLGREISDTGLSALADRIKNYYTRDVRLHPESIVVTFENLGKGIWNVRLRAKARSDEALFTEAEIGA